MLVCPFFSCVCIAHSSLYVAETSLFHIVLSPSLPLPLFLPLSSSPSPSFIRPSQAVTTCISSMVSLIHVQGRFAMLSALATFRLDYKAKQCDQTRKRIGEGRRGTCVIASPGEERVEGQKSDEDEWKGRGKDITGSRTSKRSRFHPLSPFVACFPSGCDLPIPALLAFVACRSTTLSLPLFTFVSCLLSPTPPPFSLSRLAFRLFHVSTFPSFTCRCSCWPVL
jgi:hypothetical protein